MTDRRPVLPAPKGGYHLSNSSNLTMISENTSLAKYFFRILGKLYIEPHYNNYLYQLFREIQHPMEVIV